MANKQEIERAVSFALSKLKEQIVENGHSLDEPEVILALAAAEKSLYSEISAKGTDFTELDNKYIEQIIKLQFGKSLEGIEEKIKDLNDRIENMPKLPILPKHTDFDHVKILRDLNNLEKDLKTLRKEIPKIPELVHTLESHKDSEFKINLTKLTDPNYFMNAVRHFQKRGYGGIDQESVKKLIFSYFGGIEALSGVQNDSNKNFTVEHSPIWITFNGQVLYSGSGYTLSGAVVSLDVAPSAGDFLRSHYQV
ncbi:MAG: hypothetical protein Q8N88_04305 [Nanoarchaeota archaeon]|nr:hypothetical protein [Nanoarchaeota archaeon]